MHLDAERRALGTRGECEGAPDLERNMIGRIVMEDEHSFSPVPARPRDLVVHGPLPLLHHWSVEHLF